MKKPLLPLIILSVISLLGFGQGTEVSIIPQPNKVVRLSGEFTLHEDVPIVLSDASLQPIVSYFNNRIKTATGFNLTVSSSDEIGAVISLSIDPTITQKEGYHLSVNENGIAIAANAPNGLFYGIQTLLQLLPTSIYSDELVPDERWTIPHVDISDAPRFGYRGVMLDVSRYFFTKAEVKQLIDLLALHKINMFHWHLTDDQGWRIEIKKYPKLTEVGSKRSETLVGHWLYNRPHRFDGIPHEGFYTQEDVKEIVAYAQDRFITIIPEIEMPGHSSAALAAYPELACNDGPFSVSTVWGVHQNLYCPTEKTFLFLEDVLNEVMALFPGTYIHVGGDEAVKKQWKQSQFCQDLIRENDLKDEQGLQSYFIKRIDRFLTSKGRKLIGWDEILDGGLSPNATVMSWRGIDGGIAAAKQGHDVVMTPTSHCYFDYYQSKKKRKEPLAIGGYVPLSKVYGFEPIPEALSEQEAKHILGAQGNIWAEYISTVSHMQYMALLRIAALSEVTWSTKEARNWEDFKARLNVQRERYDALKYNYSDHVK